MFSLKFDNVNQFMFNCFQLTDLMSKLDSDDFDDINDVVTPQSLGRCKTNVLFTAFQV